MPFLVFFMLAAKRQVWHATMQLFPAAERTEVKEALADVTHVLRSYLMGTALVGMILVVASWLFFMALGLDFPFLTGLVSGLCNLVPYLGAVMSWIPPLFIGLKQYHSLAPYLGIFSVLTAFHIVTANLLIPALVGWRVRLNALALTVSLLFWGWLWGAMGLDSGHPHHRGIQSDLRPRGALAARGPLAQRLTYCSLLRRASNESAKLLFAAIPCRLLPETYGWPRSRRSRFHAFRRVFFIHTANRHHRYSHRTASLAQKLESLRRSERALRRRVENRPKENVTRAALLGGDRLFNTVAGNAHQKIPGAFPARHQRVTSSAASEDPPRCTPSAPAAIATSSRSFTTTCGATYPSAIPTEIASRTSCSNRFRAQVLFANLHQIAPSRRGIANLFE